jgi:hypothetical protein
MHWVMLTRAVFLLFLYRALPGYLRLPFAATEPKCEG